MTGNREQAPLGHYTALYRELDPQETAARTGAAFHGGQFSLKVLNRKLIADWPEFALSSDADCPQALLGAYAKILVLRYLLNGQEIAARGQFLSYRELPCGGVYDRNFQGRCVIRLARAFGDRLDAFRRAAASLGGAPGTLGDASYDMPFLEHITVRLILWEGDEEFPASAQLLFSDNTSFAFDAEDLAAVGELMIGALKEVS
ncbi:MAG: DUF3786 domain-containing protein [Oscillospiraceae bacterium]|jgi:hypothetical protein|nr:DUF3786 domain-containing protein [Oscillospiraceae bacterium]